MLATRRHCIATAVLLSVTAALVGGSVGVPVVGGPAHAAADTNPPTIVLDPFARYRVGTQITTHYSVEEDYWQASYFLKWQVSDPSGLCSQTVAWSGYENTSGEDDPVLGGDTGYYPVSSRARSWTIPSDLQAFDWARGPDRFLVRATDCAGNTATSNIADSFFGIREDNAPGITYQGTWAVSRFAGFSGGTTHFTTRAGSSFTTTFSGGHGPVALVMEKAANRGSADIYVDGKFRKTINTHQSQTRHRVIVWQGLYKTGQHTLRVVNRATPGHPRIDLDAVLLCTGNPGSMTC